MTFSSVLTRSGPIGWLLRAWQLPPVEPPASSQNQAVGTEKSEGLVLRIALSLWMILMVATCIKNFISPVKKTVYPYFSHAAQHWWANLDLYANYVGFDPYRYSPTFAVALTPLGLIPDKWGGMIWAVLSVTVLLASFRSLISEMLPGVWTVDRVGYFLILAWASSLRGIWSQQSNSLILAMIIFGLVAIKQQKFWKASFLLAMPVYIKLWPLAIVLLLIVRWRMNLIPKFLVCMLLLALVPYLTKPWGFVNQQYYSWYQALTGPLQGRWGGYRDAWTIWETIAGTVDARNYKILQLVTAAGLFVWCYWQSRVAKSDRGLLIAILSGWACWQLMFGPGTERLTHGLIAPGLAWAVLESRRIGRAAWYMCFTWLMQVTFTLGDIETKLEKVFHYAPALLPVAVLMCFVWILCYPFANITDSETEAARTA